VRYRIDSGDVLHGAIERQEIVVETAVSTAAFDPNVPRTQPVLELGHRAELPEPAVDRTAAHHEGLPSPWHEAGRCIHGQGATACSVHLVQQRESLEKRPNRRDASEGEDVEQERCVASQARVARLDELDRILAVASGQGLGLFDGGREAVPPPRPPPRWRRTRRGRWSWPRPALRRPLRTAAACG
jgi:hypothetical protein